MITTEEFLRASETGSISIVKKYIKEGSDVNIQDEDGWTALMNASYYNNKEILEMLLDANADINMQNKFDKTALMYAVQYKHTGIIEMLENIDLYKLRKKLNVDNNKTLKNSNIF